MSDDEEGTEETMDLDNVRKALHEEVDNFVDRIKEHTLKTDDGEGHKLKFFVGYGGSVGDTRETEHDYYNVLVTRTEEENLW